MFLVVLFIPVVTGDVLLKSSFRHFPEITERREFTKSHGIFDPCNLIKPGNRDVNCAQLRRKGEDQNLVYHIYLPNLVPVKCDMTTNGGGWTVIQRRGKNERFQDNLFEKRKEDYEHQFGDVEVSSWIGNENLYRLTNFPNKVQVLRIELITQAGENITVEYDDFKVSSKADGYKLSIGKYNGPPGYNALKSYHGAEFFMGKSHYTRNRRNCYPPLSGGWWYSDCVKSNLNGRKFKSIDENYKRGLGIIWTKDDDESSYDVIYDQVNMKIRDADFDFCTGKMAK